jgi:RecJ-like exonuclease
MYQVCYEAPDTVKTVVAEFHSRKDAQQYIAIRHASTQPYYGIDENTDDHATACQQTTQQYNTIVKAFIDSYPNYCRACGGYGAFYSQYDPSPAGGSLSAGWLDMVDLCTVCEGAEELPQCSLCGQIMTEDGERLCTCPAETGIPSPPECWCREVFLQN